MTLRQLADLIGIHPYDLTGDTEVADSLMDEDISQTTFYNEFKKEILGWG